MCSCVQYTSKVIKGDAHDYASFQYIKKPLRVELNALPYIVNDVWYSAMSKLRKLSSKTFLHTNARKKKSILL